MSDPSGDRVDPVEPERTTDDSADPSAWLAERERLRRDREATSWALLETEQQLATALAAPTHRPLPPDDLELVNLRLVIDNLRREVDELHASTSWRLTRPLRRVSDILHRRHT